MDVIYQGATWRRRVTIVDGAAAPVDPDPIVACLCPETPLTVTQESSGVYDVSLDAATSGGLTAGSTHWELLGVVGSDTVLLTRQTVVVQALCARLP